MQRSPVDDIIDKIVAELLKLNQVDYVSQSTFNSMSEIVKSCIFGIGSLMCRYQRYWPPGVRRSKPDDETDGQPSTYNPGDS